MSETDNISVKIVILGEPAVGKTSLRLNYIGKGMKSSAEFLMTLGADLSESTIQISDKITLDAQIWDIGGQENFLPIIGDYLRGAQGAVLVYDMTRSYTFDKITDWLDRLHEHNPELENNIPFILVGNKADLDNFYDYDEKKVLEFVDYINRHNLYSQTEVEHINTSAKTGLHVEQAFKRLGKKIIRNFIELGEDIEGAKELFDDIQEKERVPDTAPPVHEPEDDEHLVKPSELLKRNREAKEPQEGQTPSTVSSSVQQSESVSGIESEPASQEEFDTSEVEQRKIEEEESDQPTPETVTPPPSSSVSETDTEIHSDQPETQKDLEHGSPETVESPTRTTEEIQASESKSETISEDLEASTISEEDIAPQDDVREKMQPDTDDDTTDTSGKTITSSKQEIVKDHEHTPLESETEEQDHITSPKTETEDPSMDRRSVISEETDTEKPTDYEKTSSESKTNEQDYVTSPKTEIKEQSMDTGSVISQESDTEEPSDGEQTTTSLHDEQDMTIETTETDEDDSVEELGSTVIPEVQNPETGVVADEGEIEDETETFEKTSTMSQSDVSEDPNTDISNIDANEGTVSAPVPEMSPDSEDQESQSPDVVDHTTTGNTTQTESTVTVTSDTIAEEDKEKAEEDQKNSTQAPVPEMTSEDIYSDERSEKEIKSREEDDSDDIISIGNDQRVRSDSGDETPSKVSSTSKKSEEQVRKDDKEEDNIQSNEDPKPLRRQIKDEETTED